jgi:hypothetical protein
VNGAAREIRVWVEGLLAACSLPVHCLLAACSALAVLAVGRHGWMARVRLGGWAGGYGGLASGWGSSGRGAGWAAPGP